MKNTNFKKYIIEGLLIVFSVLFALAINKLAENYQTEEKKNIAINKIKEELKNNSKIIKEWNVKHQEIKQNLDDILVGKNDSLKSQLFKNNFLHPEILTNKKGFISSLLTNTAWETAKTTGIVSEFDFETTQKLSYVYAVQNIIAEKSSMEIINIMYDWTAKKIGENENAILIQLNARISDLVSQEQSLEYLINNALENLK